MEKCMQILCTGNKTMAKKVPRWELSRYRLYTRKSAPKSLPPLSLFRSSKDHPPPPPLPSLFLSFSRTTRNAGTPTHPPTIQTLLLLWLHGRPLRPTREPVLFPRQPDLDHKKEGEGEGKKNALSRSRKQKYLLCTLLFRDFRFRIVSLARFASLLQGLQQDVHY